MAAKPGARFGARHRLVMDAVGDFVMPPPKPKKSRAKHKRSAAFKELHEFSRAMKALDL